LSRFALYTVPLVYKAMISVIMRTCSVQRVGLGHLDELRSRGQPWLYCSWHDNTAMGVYQLRNQDLAMMASASRDGELIARAIEVLGNRAVRGSSSFRGGEALRATVRAVREGASGAITPDGPRGPARQCQPGAVWVAALTGCPLVPYHLEADRQWRASSWDRHKFPKPFATVFEYFGEPLYLSREQVAEDEAGALALLQERMLDNTRACLEAAGHGGEMPALNA